jgi:hypothetical protein
MDPPKSRRKSLSPGCSSHLFSPRREHADVGEYSLGMLKKKTQKDTGKFFDNDGSELPW